MSCCCAGALLAGAGDNQVQARSELLSRSLPLVFTENQGQVDGAVQYYVQGSGTSIYFTAGGLTYALGVPAAPAGRAPVQRWAVRLDFVGSTRRPQGEAVTETKMSFFKGRRERWRTGVRTWSRVVYRDLWPGIDLVYEGTVNQLKYHFLVRSGVDPAVIRLRYSGADSVKLNDAGELVVNTPVRSFTDQAPVAFQEIAGRRIEVRSRWSRLSRGAAGPVVYGFELGQYDSEKPLVVDPATLLYCGYIGGSASDSANGVAVDSSGNLLVAGTTNSSATSFPEAVGPDLTFNGGDWDAFVAKVRADGSGLDYCGYIGGTGWDTGQAVAIDSAGRAYVVGYSGSDETSFPVLVGPDLTFNAGGDAFVARVKADGSGLDYCGYIGGVSDDSGLGVAVDNAGNAYVTGNTRSDETTFPVLVGPELTHDGNLDAFVAKVKADGSGLDYCGFIGGTAYENGTDVAVNSFGNAFVVGWTESAETSFPVVVGPELTYNGGTDAFVARVKADGSGFDYCGYVGGSSWDEGYGVDVDANSRAYIVGWALSTESSFPVAVGPDLTHNGNPDAFVARVAATGTGLEHCGYIGGSGADFANSVTVDGVGNAYVVGQTETTEVTFPVVAGPDLTYNGGTWDAFAAKVSAGGANLGYCGYIGGAGSDSGHTVALDGSGRACVVGATTSTEATFPIVAGPDLTYNGGERDAFVARVWYFEEIFSDDFESGLTNAWTSTVN
jgi:hypothetical protein